MSNDLAAARFAGVYAATTTPFREDGSVDFGQFGKHCAWLIEEGVAGLIPNGSLGEYEALSDTERAQIVTTAIDAADGGSRWCRGVSQVGTMVTGRLVGTTTVGGLPAVVPTVRGRAWLTGMGHYLLDPDDPFPAGFLIGPGAPPPHP